MKTCPIMLKVEDRICVVVGCGPVGLRKADGLLQAGAKVRLVCGTGNPDNIEGVEIIEQKYHPEHLVDAFIVFACTDDRELNSRIVNDARQRGCLVNSADQQTDSDFFSPSIIRRGDVVVAIGTGGGSPSLSKRIKKQLEGVLPGNLGGFVSVLESIREELQGTEDQLAKRTRIMQLMSNNEACAEFEKHGERGLRRRFETLQSGSQKRSAGIHPLLSGVVLMIFLLVICVIIARYFPVLMFPYHKAAVATSLFLMTIASVAGLRYIRTERRMKHHDPALLLGKTPSLEQLERVCSTMLTYSFCIVTVALISGLFSAMGYDHFKWFANWHNHPKLMGSVLIWCIWTVAIVMAWSARFRGRQIAMLSISGMVLTLIVVVISFLVARGG